MIMLVFDEFRVAPLFDVAGSGLIQRLQKAGEALALEGFVPPPMPMDLLYVQRKVAGMFLLAKRLRARVPIADMMTACTGVR